MTAQSHCHCMKLHILTCHICHHKTKLHCKLSFQMFGDERYQFSWQLLWDNNGFEITMACDTLTNILRILATIEMMMIKSIRGPLTHTLTRPLQHQQLGCRARQGWCWPTCSGGGSEVRSWNVSRCAFAEVILWVSICAHTRESLSKTEIMLAHICLESERMKMRIAQSWSQMLFSPNQPANKPLMGGHDCWCLSLLAQESKVKVGTKDCSRHLIRDIKKEHKTFRSTGTRNMCVAYRAIDQQMIQCLQRGWGQRRPWRHQGARRTCLQLSARDPGRWRPRWETCMTRIDVLSGPVW